MPRLRAKFRIDKIERTMSSRPVAGADGKTRYEPAEIRTIVASPVCGGNDPDHENSRFWQYTPSGRLELGCVNVAAVEEIELGSEYYLDLTPASGGDDAAETP